MSFSRTLLQKDYMEDELEISRDEPKKISNGFGVFEIITEF
jgi:hypothetical protein